jgi:hypothetical protein
VVTEFQPETITFDPTFELIEHNLENMNQYHLLQKKIINTCTFILESRDVKSRTFSLYSRECSRTFATIMLLGNVPGKMHKRFAYLDSLLMTRNAASASITVVCACKDLWCACVNSVAMDSCCCLYFIICYK